jgi:hypothetical protein
MVHALHMDEAEYEKLPLQARFWIFVALAAVTPALIVGTIALLGQSGRRQADESRAIEDHGLPPKERIVDRMDESAKSPRTNPDR